MALRPAVLILAACNDAVPQAGGAVCVGSALRLRFHSCHCLRFVCCQVMADSDAPPIPAGLGAHADSRVILATLLALQCCSSDS